MHMRYFLEKTDDVHPPKTGIFPCHRPWRSCARGGRTAARFNEYQKEITSVLRGQMLQGTPIINDNGDIHIRLTRI